jgi:hypothetical protein
LLPCLYFNFLECINIINDLLKIYGSYDEKAIPKSEAKVNSSENIAVSKEKEEMQE